MLKKINKNTELEPHIELRPQDFTIVNYDSIKGYYGEVRLSQEQARIVVEWMHKDFDLNY